MFFSLLLVTFVLAAFVSLCVVKMFSKPISTIFRRCDYPQKLDSRLRWISGWQNGHVMSHNTAQQCQELRKEFV